ncbi:MAG: DMT family transporter [Gemmatimonadales bacterium]
MVAFAANSVLTRLALGPRSVDAASFATIRLGSGAVTLLLIATASRTARPPESRAGWVSAALLFSYAAAFSFAYLTLGTGTGALILFGAVQATMIIAALRGGERPHASEWVGLVLALGGLTALVAPGLTAPAPIGSALMAVAGISWGVYSLRGRGAANPLQDTTANFIRAAPMALVLSLILLSRVHLTTRGIILAVCSGAVASGMGYVVWYAALRGLSATRAAIVQLSVPVLAALGGVLFLAETVSVRLIISGALILGGVAMAVAGRAR